MAETYNLVGISPFEAWEKIRLLREWMKDRKWSGIQKSMMEGRRNPGLYKFLEYSYGKKYEIMNWVGSTFPCAVFRPPEKQTLDPDSVLEAGPEEAPENLDQNLDLVGQTYLSLLQRTPAKPWDGTTYRMTSLQSGDQLKIRCGLGGYYNALKTCDILELEILREAAEQSGALNPSTFDYFAGRLHLRNNMASQVSDDIIVDGSGRSAAVAISTLVVFRAREGGFMVLLGERSSDRVSVHTDLVHVVPSFMFQPVVDWFREEYSVTHNIYREYLEEVFNVEEVKHPNGRQFHDYFYQNPNLLYLRQLLQDGKAQLFLTGIAVNLLNMRPEICTLLLIKEAEWHGNHSQGRKIGGLQLDRVEFVDEFKSIDEIHATGRRGTKILRLPPDLVLPTGSVRPEDFVPPGAAAFCLGLEVARKVLGL